MINGSRSYCVCGLRMADDEARKAMIVDGVAYNPNHRRCHPKRVDIIIAQKLEAAKERGGRHLSA